MTTRVSVVVCTLLTTLLVSALTHAQPTLMTGQRTELRATNPLGVPLHRESRSIMFGRAPDGSTAVILGLNPNQRWINIRLESDDRTAWIVQRYVRRVIGVVDNGGGGTTSDEERAVWTSRQECERVVMETASMWATPGERREYSSLINRTSAG